MACKFRTDGRTDGGTDGRTTLSPYIRCNTDVRPEYPPPLFQLGKYMNGHVFSEFGIWMAPFFVAKATISIALKLLCFLKIIFISKLLGLSDLESV